MEKQEIKSKWDDLARELGADVPPEAAQQDSSLANEAEQKTPAPAGEEGQSRGKGRPALPKRAAANWEELNSELGLEPPPAPPAPSTPLSSAPPGSVPQRPSRTEGPQTEGRESKGQDARRANEPKESESRERRPRRDDRREENRERRPRRDNRREERARRDDSRGPREPRTRREEGHEQSGRPQESRARNAGARRREEPRPADRSEKFTPPEASNDADDMVKTGRRAAEAADEQSIEPPKPASVSLWHKIFGLPTEQSAKLSSSSTEDETNHPSAETRDEWDVEFDRPTEVDRSKDTDAEESSEWKSQRGDQPLDEARERRPRRRRRGRKQDEHGGHERQPHRARHESRTKEEADESFGFDDEFGGAPAGFDQFGGQRSHDDDADDLDTDDGDRAGKSAHGRSAGHRNIPSWEDAIGAIVDHNLQSRPNRKQFSGPGGRGGPSRGRPRGRRRKKP